MEEIFIPTLHTFAMANSFTGSCGDFRFRLVPKIQKKNKKEVDFETSTIEAEYWHGLFCYEKSEMEAKESFPLTEEGRAAILKWLMEHR